MAGCNGCYGGSKAYNMYKSTSTSPVNFSKSNLTNSIDSVKNSYILNAKATESKFKPDYKGLRLTNYNMSDRGQPTFYQTTKYLTATFTSNTDAPIYK